MVVQLFSSNKKNTPNISQLTLHQFNYFKINAGNEFPYLLSFLIKLQAAVDKHFILPHPAAAAEKAMREAFEEYPKGMESQGMESQGMESLFN